MLSVMRKEMEVAMALCGETDVRRLSRETLVDKSP
jgi:isopentenyl diphosphate isomerase/L-lactate dehydrogenase-like FMN-dependent dehydrogenase